MSKEIRRLHRRQTQFTNFSSKRSSEPSDIADSDKIVASSNLTESTEQNRESDLSEVGYSSPLRSDGINSIRAELREDTYHSELAQSDFSNDTHDWGGDSLLHSDDYWHFVGSYE